MTAHISVALRVPAGCFRPRPKFVATRPDSATLVTGKEAVNISAIEPVGHYAVKLVFDDGPRPACIPGASCTIWARIRAQLAGLSAAAGRSRPPAPDLNRYLSRNPRHGTPETTHFGCQKVATADKARKVAGCVRFQCGRQARSDERSDVARRAPRMETVRDERQRCAAGRASAGSGWRNRRSDQSVAASGRTEGLVVLSDINARMLGEVASGLIDEGAAGNIVYAQLDAEQLPFSDQTFDCITIGFGLRNVTRKEQALADMYRALKPGGRVLILEFFSSDRAGPEAGL